MNCCGQWQPLMRWGLTARRRGAICHSRRKCHEPYRFKKTLTFERPRNGFGAPDLVLRIRVSVHASLTPTKKNFQQPGFDQTLWFNGFLVGIGIADFGPGKPRTQEGYERDAEDLWDQLVGKGAAWLAIPKLLFCATPIFCHLWLVVVRPAPPHASEWALLLPTPPYPSPHQQWTCVQWTCEWVLAPAPSRHEQWPQDPIAVVWVTSDGLCKSQVIRRSRKRSRVASDRLSEPQVVC